MLERRLRRTCRRHRLGGAGDCRGKQQAHNEGSGKDRDTAAVGHEATLSRRITQVKPETGQHRVLHVLLRHRLLRQPDGCEGFRFSGETTRTGRSGRRARRTTEDAGRVDRNTAVRSRVLASARRRRHRLPHRSSPELRGRASPKLARSWSRASRTPVDPSSRPRLDRVSADSPTRPRDRAWRGRPRSRAAESARTPRRTTSTFSCDIAYSDSPTASRAFERSRKSSWRTTKPRRSVNSWNTGSVTDTPLPDPRPLWLSRDEELASEVEHLLGVPPDVLERIEPISPEPEIPVVALEDRLQIGRHQFSAGAIFARRDPSPEVRPRSHVGSLPHRSEP